MSVRPDGRAVLCVRHRFSGFAAIPRLCVRHADGTDEELDGVTGLHEVYPGSVVWIPAPGLVPTPPR